MRAWSRTRRAGSACATSAIISGSTSTIVATIRGRWNRAWSSAPNRRSYIPEKQIAIMIEDMVLVTPSGQEVWPEATIKRVDDTERIMQAARTPALPKYAEVVTFPSGALTLQGAIWKPEGKGPFRRWSTTTAVKRGP